MTIVDVFADITCPFTHIGLRHIVGELGPSTEIIVRAWPLEWVNGSPLEVDAVHTKIDALRSQLGVDAFAGFNPDRWPRTTVPALNLAASAYDEGTAVGLDVSMAIRDALFERGQNIGDLDVLADLASEKGLPKPSESPSQRVNDDYVEGQRRGVRGSPDFWLGGEGFFCPALEIGHDASGGLTATFDTDGLGRFIERVRADAQSSFDSSASS